VFNNSLTGLSNIRNRIFSYVDGGLGTFNGDATVLACGTGAFPTNCPPDPPAQGVIVPIAPMPMQCVAGGIKPVAQDDSAVTSYGVSVTIPVLVNDIAPTGVINFASIAIVSGPSATAGTVSANPDGTVTFTPNAGFTGKATFTYTVAELALGAVSNIATVTVTVPSPVFRISRTALAFGDLAINTVSSSQTVTVRNDGNGVLFITGIVKSGGNTGQFVMNHTCPTGGAGLAPGARCTIHVSFAPTFAGVMTATYAINVEAPAASKTITATGTGLAPVTDLSRAALSFADQTINTISTAKTVTVSNTGNVPLTITDITKGGADPGEFGQNNDCPIGGAGLAPGASCEVKVRFKPTTEGAKSASIAVNVAAPAASRTMTLTGIAIP
jgi:Big-like domain-containing protein/centrosomal CEP192-like protein/HYDIN/CFA65/VesB family protein